MKNKALTFLFFFSICFSCFSQKTDFSVFVGAEATKFVEIDINGVDLEFGDVEYSSHKFRQISWMAGVAIDQSVYKKVGLSLQSSFGRKYVDDITIVGDVFSLNGIDYLHVYNALLLKHELLSNFAISGGMGNNLHLASKTWKTWYWEFEDEWIGIMSVSFSHKKLNVDLSYVFGIEDEHFLELTEPSKSFQLKVGYKFKTINWNWPRFGKKTKCPKL